MKCSIRKSLTFIVIALYYLYYGVQFTIVLPTIWGFLKGRFGSQEWFYSFCLTSTSLTNVFSGPVFGAIYDRAQKTYRILILVAILSSASGCFMYFSATSQFMVLGGRLLEGIGFSAGTVISVELARITTKKERTAVYSLCQAATQIGYMLGIGPGFNLFLRYCDFTLGPFKVDKFTSPGLFMFVAWLVLGVLFVLFYFNLPTAEKEDEERLSYQSPINSPVNGSIRSSITKLSQEDRLDNKSILSSLSDDGDENDQMSDMTGLTFERNYEVLEINPLDGIAYVVPYTPPMNSLTSFRSQYNSIRSSNITSIRSQYNSVRSNAASIRHHYGSIRSNAASMGNDPTISISSERASLLNGQFEESVKTDYSEEENEIVDMPRRPCCLLHLCATVGLVFQHIFHISSLLITEENVVILYVISVSMYCEMVVDVAFTPLAAEIFHWNELPVSIFFLVLGILMMGVSIVVTLISRRVSDRWMILVGLVVQILGCFWLMGSLWASVIGFPVVSQFAVGTAVVILTQPVFLGSGVSLLSKVLHPDLQGLGHGVRRSLVSLATVMGSLWAAGALQLDSHFTVYSVWYMLGGPIVMMSLSMLLMVVSFGRLKH